MIAAMEADGDHRVGAVPIRFEERSGSEALAGLDGAWDDLSRRAPDGAPYLARAWVQAWWRAFGAGPRLLGARSRLRVAAVWRGEALVGLLPLAEAGPSHPAGPLLVGVGQEQADRGGALLDPGDADAADALGRWVVELAAEGGAVRLVRLDPDDALLAAVRRHLAADIQVSEEAEEPYPYLDLGGPDAPARVQRLVKRNDVGRRRRRLAEVGEVRWDPDVDDLDAGLRAFFSLHDARWSGRGATGVFASPRGRRMVAEASEGLRDLGVLRLGVLHLDGRPIGARYSVVAGDRLLGLKSAWAPDLGRYGIGHLLVAQLCEDAVADGLRELDLMRGSAPHKLAWASGVRHLRTCTVVDAGWRGRPCLAQARTVLALRHRWRQRARP